MCKSEVQNFKGWGGKVNERAYLEHQEPWEPRLGKSWEAGELKDFTFISDRTGVGE